MSAARILAGDIGGTNTRLAVFECEGGAARIQQPTDFTNRVFPAFEDLLLAFIRDHREPFDMAALAVAGPVVNNAVTGTNLPWMVEANNIKRASGIPQVVLFNDLLALAYGLHELQPDDIETLQAGHEDLEGNCAVIAAGTGLGESGLLRKAGRFTPFPSEGGHSDFGPNSEIEAELFLYLFRKYGHVSFERILSGHGTVNVYEFLRDSGKEEEPHELAQELEMAPDKASIISHHGLSGRHPICVRTLEMFASVLGAEAGNLALRMFATGGIYIGGGIAPKIAPMLRKPGFLKAFQNKGRMAELMRRIPVKLIANQHTGLIGAAAYGAEQMASKSTR